MSILKIARMGHPVLRQQAQPVPLEDISSEKIQRLIQDMRDTCDDANGAGLAAPQVHISLRLVLADLGGQMRVLINPELSMLGDEGLETTEGCLSVPGLRASVVRAARIKMASWNEHGEFLEEILEDMDAVVAQHECDHLDGILYLDRCEPQTLSFLEEHKRYGGWWLEEQDDEVEA